MTDTEDTRQLAVVPALYEAVFGEADETDKARASELAGLDHQLEVERVQARIGELRARAAHRAAVRAAGETEARARAAQQVEIAVALPFLLIAVVTTLALFAVWVGALQ